MLILMVRRAYYNIVGLFCSQLCLTVILYALLLAASLSQSPMVCTWHTLCVGGNLLKVRVEGSDPPRYRLAYLDYGIVSYVPSQVRDGLVCAVAALVFDGNTAAVADLFGDLQLIPPKMCLMTPWKGRHFRLQ